jgi:hypothetical protein
MTARAERRREGRRGMRLLPVFLSALLVLPNSPFVVSAAAQVVGAAESGSASASAGGSSAAGAVSAAAPAPLALTAQVFAAPLTAGAMTAAPAASPAGVRIALAAPSTLAAAAAPAPAPARVAAARPAALESPASLEAPSSAKALSAAPAASAAGPARKEKAGSDSFEAAGEDARAGAALFDGQKVKVFMVSHGRAPVETTLASLDSALKANPDAAAGLNKNGVVRLVLGNRSAAELAASPEFKAKYPGALGIAEVSPVKQAWSGIVGNPLLKLIALPFKLLYRAVRPGPKEKTGRPDAPRFTLAGVAALPGRVIAESRFLGRTFRDAMTKPLTSEVLGGIATKSWPLAVSIGVYWTTVGLAHPVAMAGLMALSLSQEIFHGIFLNTWNNFQESLSRLRGFSYQMYFNLAYMQGFGAMYRAFSWSANPHKTIPPWSPFYWKDVLVMSLVGTFFGTLGYNGLNTLYSKGRLKRWQRSGIQQLRDVLFLLAGPFFATGSMHAFWALFIFQQSLDFTIALIAWRARTRTILYAVAEGDASGPDAENLKALIRERGVTAPASAEKLTLAPAKTEPAR